MVLKDCRIVLDRACNVYYPGETVAGYVEFVFDSVKRVRGIFVTFKGYAETSWLEERISKPRVTVNCCGTEEYFKQSYYLLGDVIAFKSHKLEIPAGTHKYPLTCTLPLKLPSSFEGDFGFIRYTVKVTLDRPWTFDQEIKMAFSVINHLDINLYQEYKIPASVHIEETFCCWCCGSSPLLLNVSTPQSGYCPGQDIPLDILCDNKSDINVNQIIITLRQIVQYMCQMPIHEVKIDRRNIGEVTLGAVMRNTKTTWKRLINIPVVPPTNLNLSNLIDVKYDLKVKCLHDGIHADIKVKDHVFIGTVPIIANNASQDIPLNGVHRNDQFVTPIMVLSKYPMLGHPEFKGGMHSASTILEKDESPMTRVQDTVYFVPKYPVYKYIDHIIPTSH